MSILLRRILAGGIDLILIWVYAGLLYLLVKTITPLESVLATSNPVAGQLVGFVMLTLPVFCYFYFFEKSSRAATFGKRFTKIKVQKGGSIIKRNILKLAPWELAHTGVHGMYYYSNHGEHIPYWVWFFLITPQILVLVYIISIIYTKGHSSLYDTWSNSYLIRT